jgi:ABC-type bacteriocin/lantibiotic exporter with double-glycine peptidase domain
MTPLPGRRGSPLVVVCLVAAAAALAVCGCYKGSAHTVSLADVGREPGWVTVSGVRVIRQISAHDCGAAALAMVLERWGIPDAAARIRQTVPARPGHGLAAGALRDFARQQGLKAFLISGAQADLLREVQQNRPVLVGLVQRYSGNQVYAHYEVVAGINQRSRRVLLLDPGNGAREDGLDAFVHEWEGAGRLALVVAPS